LSGQEVPACLSCLLSLATTTRTTAMFRFLVTFMLIGAAAAESSCATLSGGNCNFGLNTFPNEACVVKDCTDAIRNHIAEEFNAAFLYLQMGAVFAQDSVARPGMAKFMLESATEERSHANLMLDYLNKRGIELTSATAKFEFNQTKMNAAIQILLASSPSSATLMQEALKMALKMEIMVTDLIIKVVDACDCDYHAADVFTNPILDEQYDGIRKLQGIIREFEDLLEGHGTQKEMVNFMIDQKILKGGL